MVSHDLANNEMQNSTIEPHHVQVRRRSCVYSVISEYYMALDLFIAEVQRRFDQPNLIGIYLST